MARPERTGNRDSDLWFSKRHRSLNRRFYVTDIDFLEFGFDRDGNAVPKAVIDVKDVDPRQDLEDYILKKMDHPSVGAYIALADGLGIPGCLLLPDRSMEPVQFTAVPLNALGIERIQSLSSKKAFKINGTVVSFADSELDTFIGVLRGDYT